MSRSPDVPKPLDPADIAEELFVNWNNRQEDDSNNEGVEDDDGKDEGDDSEG